MELFMRKKGYITICFSDGETSVLNEGVHPMEGIDFDGGFLKKIVGWRVAPPSCPPTIGNPVQVTGCP